MYEKCKYYRNIIEFATVQQYTLQHIQLPSVVHRSLLKVQYHFPERCMVASAQLYFSKGVAVQEKFFFGSCFVQTFISCYYEEDEYSCENNDTCRCYIHYTGNYYSCYHAKKTEGHAVDSGIAE